MKEIYYMHKPTGIKYSREVLKRKMLESKNDNVVLKSSRGNFFSLDILEQFKSYAYKIKDIPFSDDFEAVILEDHKEHFRLDELINIYNALMCQENINPKLLEKCKNMMDIEFAKIKIF